MAPPAKRRKRNVLYSSSSEEEEASVTKSKTSRMDLISSSPPASSETRISTSVDVSSQSSTRIPTKTHGRAKTANHPHNAAPIQLPSRARGNKAGSNSTSSSPEKSRSQGKIEEKGKSGNIFSFFAKQAARQAEQATNGLKLNPKPTINGPSTPKEDEDDVISDGDDLAEIRAQSASVVGVAARKRSRGVEPFKAGDREIPSGSQRFFKKPTLPVEVKDEADLRPWAERFAPVSLDELAVHKRKVADVRTWLENVMHGRLRQRLLLLKGGAGTGKTTTVYLLAKSMGCEVLEWRNPVGSVSSSDGFLSMSAQFEEFMGRGGKFGQLDIFSSDEKVPLKPEHKPLDRRKSIILIEEFPNTFTRSSTTLQSFRSTILQYLTSHTPPLSLKHQMPSDEIVTPVVMIVSETLLTTSSASADSFTAHRLLGPEILQHPGIGVIEFNAIAPTLLAKALEVVVQKESRKSGRRRTPGPLVLKKLGEVGDIRSAVGSLEFLCLRGDVDGDWGAKVTFSKTSKSSKDIALTKMEEQSLELVTRREASLGIFHAVGKVVYNKRDETEPILPIDQDVERLPDYISLHARPKRSQVLVDELIDEIGTDTQTYIAALHENYILSCDAPSNSFDFSSLDHVNGCIDALSDSDLLCPSWDGSFNSTGFGGGTGGRGTGGDILRQDEISFQIAVRGLLFSLPNPVKRKVPGVSGSKTGKTNDAYKMFYPTSLKLWRMKEEIESTVDLWVTRLMKGELQYVSGITTGAAAFVRQKPGTVESWKSVGPRAPTSQNLEADSVPILSISMSARKEMLLERLPYMLTIARSRRRMASALAIKDMEKVATFNGIGGSSDDETVDEENESSAAGEEWTTDRPRDGASPRKRGLVMRGRGTSSGFPLQETEQKLVLSDDDIEDD